MQRLTSRENSSSLFGCLRLFLPASPVGPHPLGRGFALSSGHAALPPFNLLCGFLARPRRSPRTPASWRPSTPRSRTLQCGDGAFNLVALLNQDLKNVWHSASRLPQRHNRNGTKCYGNGWLRQLHTALGLHLGRLGSTVGTRSGDCGRNAERGEEHQSSKVLKPGHRGLYEFEVAYGANETERHQRRLCCFFPDDGSWKLARP